MLANLFPSRSARLIVSYRWIIYIMDADGAEIPDAVLLRWTTACMWHPNKIIIWKRYMLRATAELYVAM